MIAPALVPVAEETPQHEAPAPMLLEQPAAPLAAAGSGDGLPLLDAAGHMRPLEELEAEAIRFAITHYRGQMSEVARRLRIGRSTLYRKLDEIGLGDGRHEEAAEANENVASG